MVGNIAGMTSAVRARGMSFLGALRTVRAHGEYNYRLSNVTNQAEWPLVCHDGQTRTTYNV